MREKEGDRERGRDRKREEERERGREGEKEGEREIYDNEITSLIDIYFLLLSFIHLTFLDTLSDVLESARAYLQLR